MADSQVRVIGAGGEMVSGRAVAAEQGEILDVIGFLALLPVYAVLKPHHLSGGARHAEAPHERLSCRGPPVALFRRKLAHPRVEQPGTARARFLALVGLRRSEIAVGRVLSRDGVR